MFGTISLQGRGIGRLGRGKGKRREGKEGGAGRKRGRGRWGNAPCMI